MPDLNWEDLVDEKSVSHARAEGERRLKDLSGDQVSYIRKRAKTDLFFLATGPLQYELLSENLHGHLCTWMERSRNDQYRMILLPRGHYKSTIVTIADSIQMALPNEAGLGEHPYNLGPNVKLLIAHENQTSASRFLFEIAKAFLEKPLMLALFPELIPSRKKQRINNNELELPRQEHHKEPTFDTIGAGGASQGRHYNHMKLDDIIGKAARDSPTIMRSTQDWFDNINSLLTRVKYEGWDLIGTRWSDDDTYAHAIKTYGVNQAKSVMRAYEPEDLERMEEGQLVAYVRGVLENQRPIFPEEFDLDFINRLRKTPKIYAAQYANNPREGGLTEFDKRWLRFYNVTGPYITVFSNEGSWKVNVWNLDRTILIDPSMGEQNESDESGIIVVGTDRKMNIYLLETIKKRLIPPQLIDEMFRLYTKWNPRIMSVEKVNFSGTYRYWFQEKCRDMGLFPSIHDYEPGTRKSKNARIRGLTHYFAAGQVFIAEGMHDFRDEYESFGPSSKNKHLLDALAQGPDVWTPGLQERDLDDYRKAEELVLAERSELTGY